jgi:hypothetical protein
MTRATYSDDTTSGRWSTRLRGSRKVTIVARAADDQGFDWLAAFKREFLRQGVEAKSSNVLPILEAQPRTRQWLLRNIEGYSIFIIDLHEFWRRALDDIVVQLRALIPPGLDPFDFVLQLPDRNTHAHQFLRQMAIEGSALGRLECLLEWVANRFPGEIKREGVRPFSPRRSVELADRSQLNHMEDRQLASLLARLGAAVGDALSPERHAEALMRCAQDQRYFVGGYFACQLLRVDFETDKTYDVGPAPVTVQLELANGRIWDYVDSEVGRCLETHVRRGIIEERASHTVLGLQAADIAVALACREYESASDGEEGARARAVKRMFARVLLNGDWA